MFTKPNNLPTTEESSKSNKVFYLLEEDQEEDQEDIRGAVGDEEYWRWIHQIEEEKEE